MGWQVESNFLADEKTQVCGTCEDGSSEDDGNGWRGLPCRDGSQGNEKLRVMNKLKKKRQPKKLIGSLQSSPYLTQGAKGKLGVC